MAKGLKSRKTNSLRKSAVRAIVKWMDGSPSAMEEFMHHCSELTQMLEIIDSPHYEGDINGAVDTLILSMSSSVPMDNLPEVEEYVELIGEYYD